MDKAPLIESLELGGLRFAPSQVWGSVRLVPVLRGQAPGDLRLTRRRYDNDPTFVATSGSFHDPSTVPSWYCSYVPHALVVQWERDGQPVSSFGAQLFKKDGKRVGRGAYRARVLSRMARREERDRLRLLPLHLAMEGLLALQFGGPEVAWEEYSRQAISWGLSPRSEMAVPGEAIRGLDEALRVFELHRTQVGVMVFVADSLASVFVTSHSDDYRALHESIVHDFFGELIWHYSQLPSPVANWVQEAGDVEVVAVEDLRKIVSAMRDEWAAVHSTMAGEILSRPLRSQRCYELGPFSLQRFVTDLAPGNHNHIGECIVRHDGQIEYLKTYRLSAAQARRAYLLQQLADHQWELEALAQTLGTTKDQVILRIEKAGFGYLIRQDVRDWAHKERRRRLDGGD